MLIGALGALLVLGALQVCVLQSRTLAPPSPALRGEVSEFSVGGQALEVQRLIRQKGLTGVNLGGWLCMEDWLNSGKNGSEVATINPKGQGQCLPPLLKNVPSWASEGQLVKRLVDTAGSEFAIEAISKYRDGFVSTQDLDEIAALGLKWVRVPLSWVAFADALKHYYPEVYGKHDPDSDAVVLPDPYYKDEIAFVTMPRDTLKSLIIEAQKRGLKVIIDLHNAPGGSQRGTYNGIWPLEPVFWKARSKMEPAVPLTTLGKLIVQEMINWVESLPPNLYSGVAGLCVMNEPGHMNAIQTPYADEKVILDWLHGATELYRKSSLPRNGVKLYVSLIETAFKDFDNTAIQWFWKTFSVEERRTWVVAEAHYYMAWDGTCDGTTKFGTGAYQCGSAASKGIASGCAHGAARNLRDRWGADTQIAVNEFSMATFANSKLACKDRASLMLMLSSELDAFQQQGFQTSFWTWTTPNAKEFQAGWSLKWLMGLEEVGQCGAA